MHAYVFCWTEQNRIEHGDIFKSAGTHHLSHTSSGQEKCTSYILDAWLVRSSKT